MKKLVRHILKGVKWLVIGLLAIVVIALLAVYFPPTQRLIINKVLTTLNASGSIHIGADELRLRFPLNVEARRLSLYTDTSLEVEVGKADVGVDLLPLFAGVVRVNHIDVDSTYVGIGTPDSTLYMQARLAEAKIHATDLALASSDLDISRADLRGGNIHIALRPDTVAAKEPSEPTKWKIKLRHAQLSDIDYSMTMLPTIDSLSVTLASGLISKGEVDLEHSRITVDKVEIAKVDALYLTPPAPSELASASPVEPQDADSTSASAPIDIFIKTIRLTDSHAIYATSGAAPLPGFDPQYIEVSDIAIAVDSLRNRGAYLRVPLRNLSATERCGLPLRAGGLFEMDSTAMRLERFHIATIQSDIYPINALLGMGDLAADPSLPVDLQLTAHISPSDIAAILPSLKPMMDAMPRRTPINLAIDLTGAAGRLDLRQLRVDLPDHADLRISGEAQNAFSPDRILADFGISGHVVDVDFVKPTILDARTAKEINIPRLTLSGTVSDHRGTIGGSLKALTGKGSLALDASWDGLHTDYRATVDANQFPIQSILTNLGLADVTADIALSGHGYNPFSPSTSIAAKAALESAHFGRTHLKDINLEASLANGFADLTLSSGNPAANLTIRGQGNLAGDSLHWDLWGDVHRLDLYALGLADTTAIASVSFKADADASAKQKWLRADANVEDLRWITPDANLHASDIALRLDASDSATVAHLTNHDLIANISIADPIDSIGAKMQSAMAMMTKGIHARQIDVDSIQELLPKFKLDLTAGPANVLQSFLNISGNKFRSLSVDGANDTHFHLDAKAIDVGVGQTMLDTLTLKLFQYSDALLFRANLDNAPGTLDQFAHVVARGYMAKTRAGLHLEQADIKGQTGYKLGFEATMPDSNVVRLSLKPLDPIIGYKDWSVNPDNFIELDIASRHLDADLAMKSTESSIHLFTDHVEGDSTQEDVILKLDDIQLADWIEINPFAPPVKGALSADLRFKWGYGMLDGNGSVGLADLYYGKERVGTFDLDLDVYTNRSGVMRAQTSLMVDGVKTITAAGNLNDSTASNPFLLDLQMIHFPLSVVNPFLPPATAKLSGTLNGELDVTGTLIHPIFNGNLHFDSTAVRVDILGSTFKFAPDLIPVANNLVSFNNYAISTLNSNPITIDGTVDIDRLSSPAVALRLRADNSQIVNSTRARGAASVYGKAFIGLDAKVSGDLSNLDVDAALSVLPPTNVTYVMTDAAQTLTSRQNTDMVRFVNFADTTAMALADTVDRPAMDLNLAASLTVSPGTTINVDLSPDGKNKVQLESNGTLNFSMSEFNGEQLTGRLDLTNGFVRYTPPLMSEKLFRFQEGSYVSFNGDMLNPLIHLSAVDELKANVTQEGQNSRLVNFDVGLTVTGSLESMNVAFDLSTPDDLTVENELQSMSPEQRANQAMNLLLYGIYTGPGTSANAATATNLTGRLYSYLASTVNTWAANNIKAVDLSFGVDQYDQTIDGNTSTAMTYSYRVSKSLFDDRFKIVVGGNYNTNPDADENFAQNLINDISFEYLLNKTGTMMVKLFRHTGFESILEGEVTQTGVGFVYKRKIRKVADIFRFHRANAAAPVLIQEGKPIMKAHQPSAPDESRPTPRHK